MTATMTVVTSDESPTPVGPDRSVLSEEPDPSPEGVHDRARRVVRAAGISQREFAARIGLEQTALSKALRGSRRLSADELAAIAEVGGVPLRYLQQPGRRTPAALARAEARAVARGGRPRADPVQPDVRRAQIIEATARLIARRGLHRVRTVDIARACQTSPGTLLYHFATKDDALRAALAYYAERLHTRLDAEFEATADPVERLRRMVEVQLPDSDEDRDEWSVWVQSWNEAMFEPELRATHASAYGRWRQTVVDVVSACRGAGLAPDADPEILASRFTALVDGLALQILAGTGEMTVERMREVLLDAFEPQLSLRGVG